MDLQPHCIFYVLTGDDLRKSCFYCVEAQALLLISVVGNMSRHMHLYYLCVWRATPMLKLTSREIWWEFRPRIPGKMPRIKNFCLEMGIFRRNMEQHWVTTHPCLLHRVDLCTSRLVFDEFSFGSWIKHWPARSNKNYDLHLERHQVNHRRKLSLRAWWRLRVRHDHWRWCALPQWILWLIRVCGCYLGQWTISSMQMT